MAEYFKRIRRQLHNKLHSESGASLMVALLFFVMCAMVGTVVLVTASGSAGRDVREITDEDRQRYSLQSAAQMIVRQLSDENNGGSAEENGITCRQEWAYREVKLDWALKSAAKNDLKINGINGTATWKSNLVEGSRHRTSGSFILDVDQSSVYREIQENNESNDPDDTDPESESTNASQISAVWNEEYWTQGNADINTAENADYQKQMSVIEPTSETSDSKEVTSFTQLRDVLAMGIYRNYWNKLCKINETGGGKSDSFQAADNGLTGPMSDPWENGIPEGIPDKNAWETFSGGHYYRLGTRDLFASETKAGGGNKAAGVSASPLVINPPDGVNTDSIRMYPVYVDVTMNENFDMLFHLYCGSLSDPSSDQNGTLTSVQGHPENAASDLWITIPSKDVKAAFTSDTTTDVQPLTPLIVVDNTNAMEEESDDEITVPCYDDPFYYFQKIVRTDEEVNNGYSRYSYQYYIVNNDLERTKFIYTTTRSVTFRVSWDNGTISISDPE